ncbi:MAG: hypothetical protein AB8B56_20275 [Crocinitomicaceae bacterium]
MKLIVAIFAFCLTHLAFTQKEDSLMLVIDDVDISSIQTRKEIRNYFNDVSHLSRGIQDSYMRILNEYGFESSEYDSISDKQQMINEFLLLKMREYLSIHPYPTRSVSDTMRRMEGDEEIVYITRDVVASITLIRVFVGAPINSTNLDLKKLYLPTFYQSYKQGDINPSSLWNLLFGMYRQMKGEDYQNFEHGEDEQIEMMIDELGLNRRS